MRRILVGLVLGAFLALVGIQAAHAHAGADRGSLDACAVCALAHKAQRQAPHAAPSVSAPQAWLPVLSIAERARVALAAPAESARAPPALS